jgi:hypothetical protein
MIISTHAIRRLKHHKLVPRSMDGHRVKNFAKKHINDHTVNVYQNRKTGARVHITDRFIAVMYRDRVVTVYPNTQNQRDNIVTDANYEVAVNGELSEN